MNKYYITFDLYLKHWISYFVLLFSRHLQLTLRILSRSRWPRTPIPQNCPMSWSLLILAQQIQWNSPYRRRQDTRHTHTHDLWPGMRDASSIAMIYMYPDLLGDIYNLNNRCSKKTRTVHWEHVLYKDIICKGFGRISARMGCWFLAEILKPSVSFHTQKQTNLTPRVPKKISF